jgi:hypothetical protein
MGQSDDSMMPSSSLDLGLDRKAVQVTLKASSFSNLASSRGPTLLEAEKKPRKSASFSNDALLSDMILDQPVEPEAAGPSDPSPRNAASVDEQDALELPIKRGDFRASFLHKLSQEKVLLPVEKRPPSHQTVIIFDWDDTLLCTSFLNQRDDGRLSPAIKERVQEIERVSKTLLQLAMRLGQTYIVTNAQEGWVEYSAAKWAPGLLPLLEKVPIISARSRYECLYPREVAKWKIHAFIDLQRKFDSHIITNLISLGDSIYEMDATRIMAKEFSTAMIKTVKFQEHPTPEELYKQLDLVVHNFEKITEHAKNMKIGLERRGH